MKVYKTIKSIIGTNSHCVKGVHIGCFSCPYLPLFGLNTDIYRVNLRIQYIFRKIQIKKLQIRIFFMEDALKPRLILLCTT